MRILLFLGLSVALCSLAFADLSKDQEKDPGNKDGLEKKGDPPHRVNETQAGHEVAANSSKLAFALYKQLAADNSSKNIAFSPSGIRSACALGYLATKNNNSDQTKEDNGFRTTEVPKTETHEDIHQSQDKDNELLFFIDNYFFINPTWKIPSDFLNNSKAVTVDFQNSEDAKKQINSYVENNTNGNIVDLVRSVAKDTVSILLNYFQFTGILENSFEDKSVEDFHVNKEKTVKVPFLSTTGHYNMAVLDEATLVAVPYKGNVSALYILPNEGKMEEVEANLEDIMKKWEEHNQSTLVKLRIPTISLVVRINIKEELAKIGMTDVCPTLSGTTGDSNLNISQVIHVAKVNFDEKAQNAAKTTGLKISQRQVPVKLTINRQFLIIVGEKDKHLFLGKIVKPLDSPNTCPK